jgi:hypothetical protein
MVVYVIREGLTALVEAILSLLAIEHCLAVATLHIHGL